MTFSASDSTRGFFFWSLAPVLLLFIIVMPITARPPDAAGLVVLWAVELLASLLLLGLCNPMRFWWAFRGVGAMVFLGFVAYLIAMLYEGRAVGRHRGEPSTIMALGGLYFIGLPGLWFALFGRFTMRAEVDLNEFVEESARDA